MRDEMRDKIVAYKFYWVIFIFYLFFCGKETHYSVFLVSIGEGREVTT